MNKNEKENFVTDMKSRLEKSQATFLVDYKGLDVDAMNSVRGELRKIDTDFRVVKNRLLNLASENTSTAVLKEHFAGPCAIAISYEDEVAPARALVEQSKKIEALEIKAGQIQGTFMDVKDIERLAGLPGRDALLAQVLSSMQAVPASFVRVLNGVVVNFLQVLKAIETKKGETGGDKDS